VELSDLEEQGVALPTRGGLKRERCGEIRSALFCGTHAAGVPFWLLVSTPEACVP